MEIHGGKGRREEDRKLFNLQKAVKYNWNKANRQTRNDEKLLEARLHHYHKEKRKSIRYLEWRKYELEKRLAETAVARPRHAEGTEKEEKVIRDLGYSNRQTETTTIAPNDKESIGDSRSVGESRKTNEDRTVCWTEPRDMYKMPGIDRQIHFHSRRGVGRQNIDRETKRDSDQSVSTRFTQGLTVDDSIRGAKPAGSRKVSSWENIARVAERAPFLPEIGEDTQKRLLTSNRSRSYTVGEKSNVYIPIRERKKGVYQMHSVSTKNYSHKSDAEEKPSSEGNFSLEEQFEMLQSCRYLRSSGDRK